jgi:homoserine kinase
LGSSSAAIVAGIVAARALCTDGTARIDDDGLLRLANEIEGHPDNVAAALAGGFTLAWTEPEGARLVRLDPSPAIAPVVFVPDTELSTRKARGLLPKTVPHADAAANAARAALLVEALTRRPDLLLVATEDRLHQDYRGPAMPASLDLVKRLRADGVPATVSGAGPTVMALATQDTADQVAGMGGDGWRVHRLAVMASISWLLRIRPVPVMPSSEAIAWSSDRTMPFSPSPRRFLAGSASSVVSVTVSSCPSGPHARWACQVGVWRSRHHGAGDSVSGTKRGE